MLAFSFHLHSHDKQEASRLKDFDSVHFDRPLQTGRLFERSDSHSDPRLLNPDVGTAHLHRPLHSLQTLSRFPQTHFSLSLPRRIALEKLPCIEHHALSPRLIAHKRAPQLPG